MDTILNAKTRRTSSWELPFLPLMMLQGAFKWVIPYVVAAACFSIVPAIGLMALIVAKVSPPRTDPRGTIRIPQQRGTEPQRPRKVIYIAD